MAHKHTEAKVSIKTDDNREDLCTLDKSESLENNIRMLCKRFSMPSDKIYGLKLMITKDGKLVDQFVTNDNFNKIENGESLKITLSPAMYVDRIFNNLYNNGKAKSFDDLYKLSSDPGFLKELVRKEMHTRVLTLFLEDLKDSELAACLSTLLNLVKLNHINSIEPDVVDKIIHVAVSGESSPKAVLPALAVLCQILFSKKQDFSIAKQKVIEDIHFKDLIPYIWSEELQSLQLNTLMLINTIVRVVDDDKKMQLIKEMNLSTNRKTIFDHIIKLESNIDEAMAHELYVYQTYVLSLYNDALKSFVDTDTDILFNKKEFQLTEDSRTNAFLEFADIAVRSRQNSTDTIADDLPENIRMSMVSVSTTNSTETYLSDTTEYTRSRHENMKEPIQINHLTLESLRYYKNKHSKNFRKSLIEETAYEPGIYVTAEKVTQVLAKILHIGKSPEKHARSYQPIVFNVELKYPFFSELFSRTMWLLSKTRREMKASTKEDFPKVLKILEKQMQTILNKKPMDYKQLTEEMTRNSYQTVSEQIERENVKKWKHVLESNPSVQEYKKEILITNSKLIFKQRISVLQKGDKFPKLPQKRGKIQYIYVKLGENQRTVFWGDCDNSQAGGIIPSTLKTFDVSDIRHLVIGKACPHVKDNTIKQDAKAFTLMFEEDTNPINFVAKDEQTASYWTDAFGLLLGKDNQSEFYKKELETLIEMDCALQLLELQEINLPHKPPKIPPLPPGYGPKPTLLQKPPSLLKKMKKT